MLEGGGGERQNNGYIEVVYNWALKYIQRDDSRIPVSKIRIS